MNRPYRDVPDTLWVQCPQCTSYVVYSRMAISVHEARCAYVENNLTGEYVPAPEPDPDAAVRS